MNSVTNNITYSGSVTARLDIPTSKSIKIHNDGFKPLWYALARAMAGYDISNNIPVRFGVYEKQDNGEPRSLLYGNIPFSGKVCGDVVDISTTSSSARFTATVTRGDRMNSTKGGTVVLRMFNNNGDVLAEVEDTEDLGLANIHDSMIDGVNAVYEWDLRFSNLPANSSTGGSNV